LSRRRERIGVKAIGRKSEQVEGLGTFGIGVMIAFFHWVGMTAEQRERLNRKVIGLAKLQAATLRSQKGRKSDP